ncbi:subtilisin-like protease SBT2.4 [Panicum miliaceum]|uniref:Subtilisin-like protease SBT2.4 n=1 Tax=Panicum miliaceum TaxID=4540 RepID=A0A3L6Q607_PANMI|nr:subtilisin-like protease SBT2.4 [Panicum miliaceum]
MASSSDQAILDPEPNIMTTYTPRLLGLPNGVWRRHWDGGEGGDDGEGLLVGVVDSGIDPAHPSFAYIPHARADPPEDDDDGSGARPPFAAGVPAASGPCFRLIVTARYFAGGAAAMLPLDPSRDLSLFDAERHGRLAVYKAVYPAGGTMADLVAAIDQATQDKVDVLVLSVGPDERPTSKVTFLSMLDVALLSARRAGVFVAQAAGNRGPAESSVVSYSPWVTTVAASTTGRRYTSRLVSATVATYWDSACQSRRGSLFAAPTLQYRLVAAKDAAAPDAASMERAEECQDTEALRWRAGVLRGSIVVCSLPRGFYKGTSTVTAILDVAEALGFAGFVLVASEQYGDFLAQPLPFRVPGVMVPRVADAQVCKR